MTLVEFLLARIAEDEAQAEFVQRQQSGHQDAGAYDTWKLAWHDEYDLLCIEPSRALAECEGLRAAISILGRFRDEDYSPWSDEVLAQLALPYATHPDYDEEWRP